MSDLKCTVVFMLCRTLKNKKDAKDNLVKEFDFTEAQAEAIVMLQLYRLTNTDIVALEEEHEELQTLIDLLKPYQDKLQSTWFTAGAGIFQTYLELCRFDKESSDKRAALSLLERFDSNQLRLTNKRHFLSQSLMSTVANLVRRSVQEELSAGKPVSDFFDSRIMSIIESRLGEHRRQFPLNTSRVRV